MNGAKRITGVIIGALMFLLGVLLIADPDGGLAVAALILSISLLVYAIRMLIYYFSMARHMVGGRTILYIGVIVLDLSIFFVTLSDIPRIYIVLYLAAIHAFAGAIDVLRAFEAMRYKAPSWKFSMITGAVNIIVAVLCIVFLGSERMIVYIYAAGLIWSAITRVIDAFRKTAIVYIQ